MIVSNFSQAAMVAIPVLSAALIWIDNGLLVTGARAPSVIVRPQMISVNEMRANADGTVDVDRTVYGGGNAKFVAIVEGPDGREICAGVGIRFYGDRENPRKHYKSLREFVGETCPSKVEPGSTVSVVWLPLNHSYGPTDFYAVVGGDGS